MAIQPQVPPVQRPSYFDGQRLTAEDLTTSQSFHRELRWLHNRSLHTWGVALGLKVEGERNARSVTLRPGYALDCLGRDLIVSHPLTLPTPPVAGKADGTPAKFHLTASYAEDADIPRSETRAGSCGGEGAVRRPEEARIRWLDPTSTEPGSTYQRGFDIILASILVKNCKLAATVDLSERREARPSDQPYIAAGSTPEGATNWTFWPSPQTPLGVATTVGTTSAGFSGTPKYSAHVIGNRTLSQGGDAVTSAELLDGFLSIEVPTPTSFQLVVLMPKDLGQANQLLNPSAHFKPPLLTTIRETLKWYVVWMGMET